MNFFCKMYCRTYQTIFKWIIPSLPYREPTILNSILEIKNVLEEKNIKKVFLVTGPKIRESKLTKPLEKDLRENKIKCFVYDQTISDPTISNIEEGYKQYLDNKCEAIIAFGGGSVLDTAKIIGARASNPNKSIEKMAGLLKIKNELPLLIAVPTTAGSGSETTIAAVVTNDKTNHKYAISDFDLIPHYAVLDATLTINLPPNITATTGMDALTHAIEAFIGNSTTKDTQHYSLEAMRLIFNNLLNVYNDGTNEHARKQMLKASYMAGLAFTKSFVGYVHAVAHSLGGKYHTPHGLANAVILPYMLNAYGTKIHSKLKQIAVYCEIAHSYDSDILASNKLINKIIEMNELMNIPKTFDFIKVEDIPALAKTASKEGNPLYPVPVLMNAKELEKIYYKIMS